MTMTSAEDFIQKVANVASAVGWKAGVGASELAGQIISVLAIHPEHIDRFMRDGSELFIDGTFDPKHGSLTYLSIGNGVQSPTKLREISGNQQ